MCLLLNKPGCFPVLLVDEVEKGFFDILNARIVLTTTGACALMFSGQNSCTTHSTKDVSMKTVASAQVRILAMVFL